MSEKMDILIVDDDHDFATQLADRLRARGAGVTIAATAAETIEKLQDIPLTDLVLLDINLPDSSGMDLIQAISRVDSKLPIIMVTGDTELDTAVDAIKRGAYDYVVKPIDFEPFWLRVIKAIESHRAFRTLSHLEKELNASFGFDQFIFTSDVMQATVDHLKQLSTSDATVLITGESGVGKELAAKTLHFNGLRRMGPFVTVSCAAVPETLIENELFGHEKGSYTDAYERQLGKFELANGGTIFLDEIGELSPMMQTKLLRVLQERSFHRIGGVKEVKVDVRVITATNKDLSVAVAQQEFRADLFYRVSVLPVTLPPLRERQEDIDLLAEHFLRVFAEKTGKPFTGFSEDALYLMRSYSWPGNVRELQNAVERAVVFAAPPLLQAKDITLGPLSKTLRSSKSAAGGVLSLKEVEAAHINGALSQSGWNISKAAAQLGIGRDTLYRKIRQYGIKEK
jgi:DNA-binding NtrC family response regulator